MRLRVLFPVIAALPLLSPAVAPAGGDWLTFNDETSLRIIVSDPAVGIGDVQEKDFAHADVDQDGDVDLVVVRKQPWSGGTRHRNVLFMNEGIAEGHALDGVLVDRTLEYASAATDGGQGMLDLTNDRDVVLVDVDNDGWLDIVTATSRSLDQPVTISHPRVYMNLGAGPGGWLGFRYEHERFPMLHPTEVPRFMAVAAGDVTGDGLADLYFGDTDLSGTEAEDLNDRLLINQGGGFFADETAERMTPQMVSGLFANAAVIADFNGDGAADIARARFGHIGIAWNDPKAPGFFSDYELAYTFAPTHVTGGDINQDGLPDLLVTDDGTDRYMLNQGNGPDGKANFTLHSLPETGGFGGNTGIGDLNGDGLPDMIITDVDFTIPGCSRVAMVLRHTGTAAEPAFVQDPANLPVAMRTGTHDVAIFDLDGDGGMDVILGRCSGYVVLMIDGPCFGDTNSDGIVDVDDLINVLLDWGTDGSGHRGDINDSGVVDVDDLVTLIFAWGEC